MIKLYDKIRKLLEENEEYRNSDRKLIWRIWDDEGRLTHSWEGEKEVMTKYDFMKCTSPETVRRTRQKVQSDHPELQSSKKILEAKKNIEKTKGVFVYHEKFTGRLF